MIFLEDKTGRIVRRVEVVLMLLFVSGCAYGVCLCTAGIDEAGGGEKAGGEFGGAGAAEIAVAEGGALQIGDWIF